MEQRTKLRYTVITDKAVQVNGHQLECGLTGSAMLTELYRAHVADWPKFFKMDTLSKVGFLASELLLKECGEKRLESEEYTSARAVVLFGTTASLCADRNYQETIQDKDNYYPSPALFVYTLPNIVTGEIAIRNHYRGETSFYVLDSYDAQTMAFHIHCSFQDSVTESVLAGWVDSTANDDFKCFFTLVNRVEAQDPVQLENNLTEIMDNLK
ncbi:MAG: hypothetical protein IK006_05420 [Bacteroidaceae bacterium]|nr:hypothetical protein [Bacteroidaceae bacterium]